MWRYFAPLLVGCVACTFDWDALDPANRAPVEPSGSGGGGDATAGGFGGEGGDAAGGRGGGIGGIGGVGGVGGVGGAGGALPVLVDTDLVARYYLDEASSGAVPMSALDAAPNPLHLPHAYAGNMAYVAIDGNRGLSWPAASLDDGTHTLIGGTKIHTMLEGSERGTIECVVNVQGAEPLSSRLFHVGTGFDAGNFTLSVDTTGELGFDWEHGVDDKDIVWTVDWIALGRTVVHFVLDTTLAVETQRARLFINGVEQPPGVGALPDLGDAIAFVDADSIALGNRALGQRSIKGELFYCAVYASALSPAAIANNVEVLSASDDAP